MDKLNIIFLTGLGSENNHLSSFLGYLPPIISNLEEDKLKSKIFDIRSLPDLSYEKIINELKAYNFDSIGISVYADNIRYTYKACSVLKKEFPNTKIILGGPQVTYSAQKTLTECECDIVVRHEGELQLREILLCLKSNSSFKHVKGISYRQDDKIIHNENAPLVDMNKQPTPQFGILKYPKYWIIPKGITEEDFNIKLDKLRNEYYFFMTGRGCPHKCAFCVEGNNKNTYRYLNLDGIAKHLKYFLSITNSNYVMITDDTFTTSPKRIKEVCQVFKEVQKTYPFFWFCEGRVDLLSRHPELIGVMYDAGLSKLQIGVESGNQKVLDIYNKKITLDQIRIVVKEASKYDDLFLHANIILGNPNETFDEFKKGLDFIKELLSISNFNVDISQSYLIPYFGTPIREQPEKFNIELLYNDFEFESDDINDFLCKPYSLSLEELKSLRTLAKKEIDDYINNNIYKLPKNIIIKNCIREKRGTERSPLAWNYSFGKLDSFKKYLKVIKRDNIVNVDDIHQYKFEAVAPLRMWEFEYDFTNQYYSFISLDGEKITMDNERKFLWEKATGKKSIYEIFKEGKELWINLELDFIIEFYKKLESKMAIVFVSF